MKDKARKSSPAKELQFELKYCERCGGLWLRPVGGGQVYCAGCWREIAQLPPASHEAENPKVPRGPRWGTDEAEFEGYEDLDLDVRGGVE
jgi:hypothetical protein